MNAQSESRSAHVIRGTDDAMRSRLERNTCDAGATNQDTSQRFAKRF